MEVIWQAVVDAVGMLLRGEWTVWEIIGLSLRVSGLSLLIAIVIGVPIGYWVGAKRFRGRGLAMVIVNTPGWACRRWSWA
jgi:tungstate transport system permease protein